MTGGTFYTVRAFLVATQSRVQVVMQYIGWPIYKQLCANQKKVLTPGGCSPVLGFVVSKQATNWCSISTSLFSQPHLLRAQPACLSVVAVMVGLVLPEVHPEKPRRWREKRMLSGPLISVASLDTREEFGLILLNQKYLKWVP